ncbi:MAG TPA: type IV pilus assembly protein PilM [Chthoniobacteraceae bacterium]|nr:type IV pilus assembly protein PilM [Chthoniobacteraceae bacterium]
MAAPKRILSLSLGTQTIGIAEFKTGQNGGLVLSSNETRELLADPAADATRLAQTKLLVQEMVGALKQKRSKVNYAVSAQSVFTRFVKLPSVGEEQVDQIVTFEAQQNVPYPIDEVVWDYQLVDSGESTQVEVVIVAVKSDLLDEINDSVEASSLKTTIVDVAPMALYNAFRYNYSDVHGCSLIIDIGSRTTNLIFIEPHKVFSRSIPNGGSTITAAIAKEFQEPFAVAEERKKRDGFVGLGGSYADPDDEDVARASKIIRNAMTRLHAEIARSISFYRSQQGGSAPQQVFLSGGSASLPYMREFFTEKFQLPVEYFNAMRNVTVVSGINVEELGRRAHTLGELVGLALRGTSACPMELNLRPARVVRRHELARRRPYLILAGLCVFALLAAWYVYFDRAAELTAHVTSAVEAKTRPLVEFNKKIEAAMKDKDAALAKAAPLVQAIEEKNYWVRILDDINKRLPPDYVWITSFEAAPEAPAAAAPGPGAPKAAPRPATKPGEKTASAAQPANTNPPVRVTLRGLYLYNDRQAGVVDDFVAKLKESELYAVDEENLKRAVPNETEWAFDFEIPLALKNPIATPVLTAK